MQSKNFNVNIAMESLRKAHEHLAAYKDVPFVEIETCLNEISKLFKQLNTFLGIAFEDVQAKVTIINGNRSKWPEVPGFLEFVGKEMKHGIHVLNGENNSKHKAPAEYKKYVSTARSLLRMMWLMTFIKVFFNDALTLKTTEKLSGMLDHAYDEAFGEKHSWIIRKGAKLAILAAPNKKYLIETMLGKHDEPQFYKLMEEFLGHLNPVWEALWGFYRTNNLVNLE